MECRYYADNRYRRQQAPCEGGGYDVGALPNRAYQEIGAEREQDVGLNRQGTTCGECTDARYRVSEEPNAPVNCIEKYG